MEHRTSTMTKTSSSAMREKKCALRRTTSAMTACILAMRLLQCSASTLRRRTTTATWTSRRRRRRGYDGREHRGTGELHAASSATGTTRNSLHLRFSLLPHLACACITLQYDRLIDFLWPGVRSAMLVTLSVPLSMTVIHATHFSSRAVGTRERATLSTAKRQKARAGLREPNSNATSIQQRLCRSRTA